LRAYNEKEHLNFGQNIELTNNPNQWYCFEL